MSNEKRREIETKMRDAERQVVDRERGKWNAYVDGFDSGFYRGVDTVLAELLPWEPELAPPADHDFASPVVKWEERKIVVDMPKPKKKARKNPWHGLSPAARLARVNAIRKGRGLAPRKELA